MVEEALYTVEFGGAGAPLGELFNGGVLVLDTNRMYGGDSGYYYIGTYEVKDGLVNGHATIVKHNPAVPNAFGDAAQTFEVLMAATTAGPTIDGIMTRVDMPGSRIAFSAHHAA